MNNATIQLRTQQPLWLFCILLCVISLKPYAQESVISSGDDALPVQTVVIPPWGARGDKQSQYFPQLLALAFAKTEATDGPIIIKIYPENLSGTRSVMELKHKNTIHVSWYGATAERMQQLLPIKVSLLKNLNEYRVLLIRKEDQAKFSQVQTLDDLRQFTSGVSSYWSVTALLRENKLPVKTVNDFGLLFPMLKAGRFDYISRNIIEIWEEARLLEQDDLVIEQELLLKGGAPLYFFVNKTNVVLADRIERGLNLALADGSFDQLLSATPGFAEAAQEIESNRRRVLDLHTNQIDSSGH